MKTWTVPAIVTTTRSRTGSAARRSCIAVGLSRRPTRTVPERFAVNLTRAPRLAGRLPRRGSASWTVPFAPAGEARSTTVTRRSAPTTSTSEASDADGGVEFGAADLEVDGTLVHGVVEVRRAPDLAAIVADEGLLP